MVQQRTHGRTVTFLRPFALRGVDGVQPPGTYTVETEEELIEGLSFPAYRRKATVMLLPALDSASTGSRQIATIDPLELQAAQARDGADG
jgi:hypothetical protein